MKKLKAKKKASITSGKSLVPVVPARPVRAGGRSFSDVKTFSRDKTARIDEKFGTVDFKKANKKFLTFRIYDTMLEAFVSIAQIWVKKNIVKDGDNKVVTFPRLACNWDPFKGEFTSGDKDPYLGVGDNQMSAPFYMNAICRELQERQKKWPLAKGKKPYFDDDVDVEDAKRRTPVRVLGLPGGVVADLGSKFKQLNTVKIKKGGKLVKVEKDLTDVKYGRDISICYDKDAAGGKKYSIQIGPRTPMTEEELKYLRWDLVKITEENFISKQTFEEAKAELKRDFGDSEAADDYVDDDEDDTDLGSSKKKKKLKVKVKTKTTSGTATVKKGGKVSKDKSAKKKVKSKVEEKPAKKTKLKVKAGKSKPAAKPSKGKSSKKDDFEDDIPF